MAPFSWLGRFIAGLWHVSRRSWIDVGMGLRPGSGASALVLFLFLIFVVVGLVLLLLGVSLGDADRWLEAQAGWLDAVGSWLFSALCGAILLICLLAILLAVFGRGKSERPGLGCVLLALVTGYFAWFGMTG